MGVRWLPIDVRWVSHRTGSTSSARRYPIGTHLLGGAGAGGGGGIMSDTLSDMANQLATRDDSPSSQMNVRGVSDMHQRGVRWVSIGMIGLGVVACPAALGG